jgi:hypothetical protein
VIERLKPENEKLREKIAGQATQIAEADQQITKAEQQIADLERQLALRQQNSTTSSKPPCSARPRPYVKLPPGILRCPTRASTHFVGLFFAASAADFSKLRV